MPASQPEATAINLHGKERNMSVEFRTLDFSDSFGKSGPTPFSRTTGDFSRPPISVEACIRAWKLEYKDTRKELREEWVKIREVSIEGSKARVTIEAGLNNDAKQWNNPWGYELTVLVIAVLPDN